MEDLPTQFSLNNPWLVAISTWLLWAQTFAKLVQPRFTEGLTRLFLRVLDTDDKEDDRRLRRMLSGFNYWLVTEIADLVLRIKLPTLADLQRMEAARAAMNVVPAGNAVPTDPTKKPNDP